MKLSLTDEHPIKWIAMIVGQLVELKHCLLNQIKAVNAVALPLHRDETLWYLRERKPPSPYLIVISQTETLLRKTSFAGSRNTSRAF